LGRVTSPVHRYLILEGRPRQEVRRQYLEDLRERWMLPLDPMERNKRYKRFSGKLVELQVAEWLEYQGRRVSGLEALREGPDIEACAKDGRATAFEVKYIGTEDEDFALILESLAGGPAIRTVSQYDAANYLLFRMYEAAKQLERLSCDRIGVVVVEDMAWPRFDSPLRNGWVEWKNPKFFPSPPCSDAWKQFFTDKVRPRYPEIENDLEPALKNLSAIWILRKSGSYEYHREIEERIGSAD